ncbi:hypothetical protein GCM10027347_52590 [Larkinella harenae]
MAILVNRFNFIVFSYLTPPEPEDLHNLPQGGYLGKMVSSVVMLPGETYTFFVNNSVQMPVGDFTVHLRTNANKPHSAGVGTANSFVNPALGINQYYITFKVPQNLPEGYYRLVLQAQEANTYWISSRLLCLRSGVDLNTALFSWRNRRSLAHIPYELPAMNGFRNILRLKCVTGVPQADTETEDYRQVTTGRRVAVEIKQDLAVPFKTPLTDAIGHEGWQTLLRHKDILINGSPYSIKTGYNSGSDHRRISEGSFEMYQTDFSEVNRC